MRGNVAAIPDDSGAESDCRRGIPVDKSVERVEFAGLQGGVATFDLSFTNSRSV